MFIRNKNYSMKKSQLLVTVLVLSGSLRLEAQVGKCTNEKKVDTISHLSISQSLDHIAAKRKFIHSMILPAALTTYGVAALENDKLKSIDNWVKRMVWDKNPHQPAHFDDALQYIPGFSVYVLNGLGVNGKNNLLDATRQYFISSFLMMIVVQSGKAITRLKRPDGFGTNTFPGGHTATAFVAAEFLHQEFKDKSPLISIAGYSMATIVGYMRIYNNRHWMKDDIAGAGIGLGITKFLYWIYPKIKTRYFKDRPMSNILLPYSQNGSIGLSFIHNFN